MKKITLLNIICVCSLHMLGQGNVQIGAGTTLNSSKGAFIVLDNMHLDNYGTIREESGDGTFKFTGNLDTRITGNGTMFFDRILIDKQLSSHITLVTKINVASEVRFSNGLLNLGDNILDLGDKGVLAGESESSYASAIGRGYIQVVNRLHAPLSIDPGNLGAIITSSSDLGITVIRRGNSDAFNTAAQRSSVLRYYDIIPANNIGLNAVVRFKYIDAELNRNDESLLTIWKSRDRISWSNEGFKIRNTALNYLEQEKINEFFRFTLSVSNDLSSASTRAGKNEILKDKFSIWPNPVREKTTVSITSLQNVKLKLLLYDSKGLLIRKQENKLQAGTNQIQVNMNYIPQGTYLLFANWGETNKTVKLHKL